MRVLTLEIANVNIISIILALIFMQFVTGAYANTLDTAEGLKESSSQLYSDDIQKYKIVFNDETSVTALEKNSVISSFESNVTQTVFKLNVDGQKYTLGYYNPNGTYSYENMKSAMEVELKLLKEDIGCEKRAIFNFEDLQIKEIELLVNNNSEVVKNYVTELDATKYSVYNKVDVIHSETYAQKDSISSVMPRSLNGSYHYIEEGTGHDAIIKWHNGTTNSNSTCAATLSEPHRGDGNTRYADGYQWFPNHLKAEFDTDVTPGYNRSKLSYLYYSNNYNNLLVDSNETLEMELVFYHRETASTPINVGHTFQEYSGKTWSTNQPNAYLDTNFADGSVDRVFCVGVDDANDLNVNTWYYWSITSVAGTASTGQQDGRFKANAQRGYKYLVSGAYGVFAEEHEGTRSLGVLDGDYWNVNSAYYYADSNTVWRFDATEDDIQ